MMKRLGMSLLLALAIAFTASSAAVVADAPSAQSLQSFDGSAGWLNSPPLSPSSLSGKVVLVDFWEYTCINCLRTLPYLRAWNERYQADGLVIIGVHSPEFSFSGEKANVAAATSRLGITWPVVLDPNHTIWERFAVPGWPTEDLYDQQGRLVDTQTGEGNYPQTEAKIQSLLLAANPGLKLPAVMPLLPQDSYDKPGATCYLGTPETYVGPWHGQAVANAGMGNDPSIDTAYEDPGSHIDGDIYLQGYWHASPDEEAMVSGGGNGYLAIKYKAIQVVSVIKPEKGSPVRVNVLEDGQPIPKADAGPDIQFDSSGGSYVVVDAPRAYELLDNVHFGEHELRLMPQGYGAGFYSFAFESCEVGADK